MKETTTEDTGTPTTLDLRPEAAEAERISAALDGLAADLRGLWCHALEGGDFEEITRLAEAGHAVQCAVIALRADNVLVARTEP
jgi:hypothetical protein